MPTANKSLKTSANSSGPYKPSGTDGSTQTPIRVPRGHQTAVSSERNTIKPEAINSPQVRQRPLEVKSGIRSIASKAHALFLNAKEWLNQSFDLGESEIVIGSPQQAIVRPLTKNLIEGPEKTFKTTFALRLMLGLSCGKTLFPELPVMRPRRVLYVHGELSPPEIQERTRAAIQGLSGPLTNFIQGRDLRIHLIEPEGQRVLRDLVREMRPDDLVLDPWQSFIPGFDENEFRDVSRATRFMDQLIEDFKITIYLVTHTGKDHSRGTRGHSSLAGWRDTLFKLNRKNNIVEVKIDPRWGLPVELNLEFKDGTVWTTEKSLFAPRATQIRSFLKSRDGRATKDEIAEHLGLEGDTLRKAFGRAENDNAIVIDGELVSLPEIPEPTPMDHLMLKG